MRVSLGGPALQHSTDSLGKVLKRSMVSATVSAASSSCGTVQPRQETGSPALTTRGDSAGSSRCRGGTSVAVAKHRGANLPGVANHDKRVEEAIGDRPPAVHSGDVAAEAGAL
jgi:hypothetical protein